MKNLLLRNAGFKLLSLVLAALLWYSLTGQRRERISERGYVIPLTIINLPPDLVIASPVPDTVNVRLKGPFAAIRETDSSKIEAVIDLAGSEPGDRFYKLSPDDINAPDDLEIETIDPATIRIRLDRLAKKEVRIVPSLGRRVPDVVATVDPPLATVAGPQGAISRLTSLATDPLPDPVGPGPWTLPATISNVPGVRILSPRGTVLVHLRKRGSS